MNREGTQGQELKERPRKNTAEWFALSGFLICLSYAAQVYVLRDGTAQNRLGLPTITSI